VLVPLLLYLLLTAGGLALVHAALLLRGRPLPWAAFVVFGSALSTVAGLAVLHEPVLAQARRSPVHGALWGVLLALGFFAAGAVIATAWAGCVRGLAVLAGRVLTRRR